MWFTWVSECGFMWFCSTSRGVEERGWETKASLSPAKCRWNGCFHFRTCWARREGIDRLRRNNTWICKRFFKVVVMHPITCVHLSKGDVDINCEQELVNEVLWTMRGFVWRLLYCWEGCGFVPLNIAYIKYLCRHISNTSVDLFKMLGFLFPNKFLLHISTILKIKY